MWLSELLWLSGRYSRECYEGKDLSRSSMEIGKERLSYSDSPSLGARTYVDVNYVFLKLLA
jgi:hypothetical protein